MLSLAACLPAGAYAADHDARIWHGVPPDLHRVPRIEAAPPDATPDWELRWNGDPWRTAGILPIDRFHQKSDPDFPVTEAKILHAEAGLHVFFRVKDRYVRSVTTEYQGPVYRDACVEFFFEPDTGRGYINMEINAGGTLLMKYHDPALRPGDEEFPAGYRLVLVPWDEARAVRIRHSLPRTVDPEITSPVVWYVEFFVPFDLLEKYLGPIRPLSGRTWRVNLYKISLDNSHPHRATWAPIPPEARQPGFHQPNYFAPIVFE